MTGRTVTAEDRGDRVTFMITEPGQPAAEFDVIQPYPDRRWRTRIELTDAGAVAACCIDYPSRDAQEGKR